MRLEITRNFITPDECALLNAWVYKGVANKWLAMGVHTDKRLTSRMYGHRFEYPNEVLDLSCKIRSFAGIANYKLIWVGRDGIVVSYTPPGGDVFSHKDPKSSIGYSALRCNIMTQAADDGGELFVDGNKINIGVGDLHCYLASDFEHYVTEVKGNTPRILWMFGACVPKEHWENGEIKYGVS